MTEFKLTFEKGGKNTVGGILVLTERISIDPLQTHSTKPELMQAEGVGRTLAKTYGARLARVDEVS